jgi:hypothetical protein
LHPTVPFQEVEHLLASMHVPERSRTPFKGHPADG